MEAPAVALLRLLDSPDEVRPSMPSPRGCFVVAGAWSPGLNAVAGVDDWPGENLLLASAGEIFRLGLVRLRRSAIVGESGWGELLARRLCLPLPSPGSEAVGCAVYLSV